MVERRYVSPVTCADDGLAHLVTDAAMAATARGVYTAVCGHWVRAAPMIFPVGRSCERCHSQLEAQQAASHRGRHRPGLGRWRFGR